MEISKLKRIVEAKHLSEYSIESIFTDIGLYESVIIDPSDIRVTCMSEQSEKEIFVVSRDVEALHDLLIKGKKILLPCPSCRDERPFVTDEFINPMNRPKTPKMTVGKKQLVCNVFDNVYAGKKTENYEEYPDFPPEQPMYTLGHDFLADCHREAFLVYDYEDYRYRVGTFVREWLLKNMSEIRLDLNCTMDNCHRLCVDFVLEQVVCEQDKPDVLKTYEEETVRRAALGEAAQQMSTECKEAYELFQKASVLLAIKKIGQYPSIADMQLFDTGKYRKVLDKQGYRDLTTAIGLFASGIGCGSFVYLRRIFENLVEEVHKECQSLPNWDEGVFEKSRFNEKIILMEKYGKKIIPDELCEIKTKIYGVLSKGVHSSSDDECKELFPYLKFAIEVILDEKLAKKERANGTWFEN